MTKVPHISQTNERGTFGRNAKKHENTTVLNEQNRTLCVFKCWLKCQLASFEALLSLEKKTHRRSKAIVERGPCFASCRTRTICVEIGPPSFLVSHQTSPVQEFWWSQNGAIWDQKKAATHIPILQLPCDKPRRSSQRGAKSQHDLSKWQNIRGGRGVPGDWWNAVIGCLPG